MSSLRILLSPFNAWTLERSLLSKAVNEVLEAPEMRWSKATAVRAFFRLSKTKKSVRNH